MLFLSRSKRPFLICNGQTLISLNVGADVTVHSLRVLLNWDLNGSFRVIMTELLYVCLFREGRASKPF